MVQGKLNRGRHTDHFVSDIAIFVLKRDVKLQLTNTLTIRLGATPSGLTSANLHHSHIFTGRMPFLPPNQQYQCIIEGKWPVVKGERKSVSNSATGYSDIT